MRYLDCKQRPAGSVRRWAIAVSATFLLGAASAGATIPGISGTLNGNVRSFDLTASTGYVGIPDGASIYMWGYGETGVGGHMQLPGPTLIVTKGETVSVTLTNGLPASVGNTSIVFPGQSVTTTGGVPGLLTQEAPPGQTVTYTFDALEPGTYQYHSATRPDLQIEMGLFGALIVRPASLPAGCSTHAAYDHAGSCYDYEYLFLLSEIDLDIHRETELQVAGPGPIDVATEPYWPEYWMINGRSAPDTMAMAFSPTLPNQPYNCMPRIHPGEGLLMRIIGAGRQMHPYHFHGNNAQLIARDAEMLVSTADPTKLSGPSLFTAPALPGGTMDLIFRWTGKDLGWDIYGHTNPNDGGCVDNNGDGYDDTPAGDNLWEWCADHGQPIPVELPDPNYLAWGGFYSGSPFLGLLGQLPPGEGGLNPNAGFTYMWHSHNEREMVNNDLFPGGMMTMLIIEPPGVPID